MFVAVMAVMRMAVTVRVNGGFRARSERRSGRAIVLVIAAGMVVRVRMHTHFTPFYAPCACLANRRCLLSGYLDT